MLARLGEIFSALPQSNTLAGQRREPWIRDVTGLMAVVLLIAALVIACATLAGVFVFQNTLPVYILLVLISPAWWGARHGGWRWAAYFPALLCFALGIYSSIHAGSLSFFVLYYAMSVLLAGMLISNRMGFCMVLISTLTYTGLGLWTHRYPFDALAYLTFFFGLVGIALLQWYTQTNLQKMLKAQVEGNQSLKAEIARRQQAEQAQLDQETQLRRLAENMTDMVTEIDPNGTMLYVSPSHLPGLGYAPEALLGTSAFELVHPDDRPAAYAKIK